MSLILMVNAHSSGRRARHRVWPFLALLPLLLLAACTSPEQREAQHFERAIALYEEGDDQRAMVELRNVLQINPKNAEAIYQMGLIHERAGRLRQAAAAFRDAANERPNWVAAQFKLGTIALQVATTELLFGLEATAAEAAEAIEKAEPGHPDGLALQAALALINGETQQALDHAKAALDKAPQHPEATAMLAGAYTRLGENDRALAAIDDALQNAPENKVLWDAKLAIVEHKGDYGETVRAYEDLLALQPDNAAYWRALANLHRGQGDLEQAEEVLRRAIENGLLTDETVGALLGLVHQREGMAGAEAELKSLIARAPDNMDLRFQLAALYVSAERPDDAEAILNEIIGMAGSPDSVQDARAEIAQLRFVAGDVEGADKLIGEVLAEAADHPKANLLRGAMLVRDGAYDDAMRSARAALRRDPTWVPALRLLAEAQLAKGERDLAADTLGLAVGYDPRDVRSAERLASLLSQRGDNEAALKLWDHVLRISPDSPRALQARAGIAIAQRNWSEARANIDWLSKLPDQEAAGAELTGRMFSAQGRLEEARKAFAEAASERPEAPEPVIALTRTYVEEGDIDGALADLEQRIRDHPDDPVAFNLKGGLLARQGRLDEAEPALREAMRLRPEWLIPHHHLAYWLMEKGEFSRAVDVYQEALGQEPDDPATLYQLGAAYQKSGTPEEAIRMYERLLELQPQADTAVNAYAALIADFAYEDPERLTRALDLASRFRGSDKAGLLDTLGWLYYRSGEFAVAASFLERAVTEAPEVPTLRYHLGMALARSGQAERAIEQLERAVADGVDYPGLDEARATLAELQKQLSDASLQTKPADRES